MEPLIEHDTRIAKLEAKVRALESRARGAAWGSWTPLLGQSGVVAATVDASCRYTRLGNLVIASFRLTATAAGNPGFQINMAGLPASFLHSGARAVGSFTFYKPASNTFYDGSILPLGTTEIIFNVSGSTGYFGSNPAITLANGDVMTGTFIYEAA